MNQKNVSETTSFVDKKKRDKRKKCFFVLILGLNQMKEDILL